MSVQSYDQFEVAINGLRRAMEERDTAAIEKASGELSQAIEAMRAVGAWHADADLKTRMKDFIPQIESSLKLARLMADLSGQMHSAIADRAPDACQPLYQRTR